MCEKSGYYNSKYLKLMKMTNEFQWCKIDIYRKNKHKKRIVMMPFGVR